MNAFADTLFSVLLGWVRTFVQSLWGAVSNGGAGSFFTWLGDHWLMLVIVLCLLGVIMDYLIWIVRWRPYLLWRTKMRHFFARLRGDKTASPKAFERGFQSAVPITFDPPAPQQDSPYEFYADRQEAYNQSPEYQNEQQQRTFPVQDCESYLPPQENPTANQYAIPCEQNVFQASPLPYAAQAAPDPAQRSENYTANPSQTAYSAENYPVTDNLYQAEEQPVENAFTPYAPEDAPVSPQVYTPPVPPAPSQVSAPLVRTYASYDTPLSPASPRMDEEGRRRRSGRYAKKGGLLNKFKEKLSADDETEEQMLDGLPPVVNKEDAFHAPVYPNQVNRP